MIIPLIGRTVNIDDRMGIYITDAGEKCLYFKWPGSDAGDEHKIAYTEIKHILYTRETIVKIKKKTQL